MQRSFPCLAPRSLRPAAFVFLLSFTIFWLTITHWTGPKAHTLQHSAFSTHTTSLERVADLCAAHHFPPAKTAAHNGHRRVYDLFLLSTELDWLEIRLNTLSSEIDYFVIVESDRTFTGLTKPLHLRENWDKFSAFHQKIVYVTVEDRINSTRTWDHEDGFRNALLYETFPHIAGTEKEPSYGDVLVVSDIDEIPRPETIVLLRHCDFPERLTLRSHFYYYSFQWLHRGEQWAHPQATVYRGLSSTISPVDLRNGEGGSSFRLFRPLLRARQEADLFDAAWHCSSCFRTVREMQTKMASFSHTPWNTPENRDSRVILERVRNGWDLFNRKDEVYDKVEGNKDVPKFILGERERFRYLLDRDGPDAAFEDVEGSVSA